jgi:hypothetical protein
MGLGFPGTESVAPTVSEGAGKLVSERVFVFIPDTDGDLRTHEKFPANRQIRLRATTALAAHQRQHAQAASGRECDGRLDAIRARDRRHAAAQRDPGDDAELRRRRTSIRRPRITVEFTEPIQPPSLGSFTVGNFAHAQHGRARQPSGRDAVDPGAVHDHAALGVRLLEVGVDAGVSPSGQWSGDPARARCRARPSNEVTIQVCANQLRDLATNTNTQPATTHFTTREGPGLVNAPDAPDVI